MSFKIHIALLALLTTCCVSLYAQITEYPYVESQYRSEFGTTNVIGVIVDEENTIILLEDITPRGYSGLWISFSNETILTTANSTLRIKYWGYWDGEDIQEKEFNQRYSLQADRKYHFVLVFPRIPSGTKKISIRENISGGFYWDGIHLNNMPSEPTGSSSSPVGSDESFEPNGSGTCFAINSAGYLATCYHVIEGAQKIKIRGVNGDFSSLLTAKIIASDRKNDLAILQIIDDAFSTIIGIPYTISDKSSDVGEDVFVLGYPLRAIMGDEIKLTSGLISSKTGFQGDATSYQISATVQPGNSGGPLFDGDGNVIGVINSRLTVESASYAIKSPYLKLLANSIDETISFPRENKLVEKSLTEQIKEINRFVYIIETE